MRTPATRVREHRRAAGLTQVALANAAGVSRATVQRIERQSVCPTNAVLGSIALALKADPTALLGHPDPLDLLAPEAPGDDA
jgi:transcriptional regulator with XRE-family HTH domain